MVDIASNAKSARAIDSATARRPSSAASTTSTARPVARRRPSTKVRLEIERQDERGGLVYRLIDAESGELVRQWPTDDVHEMREFMHVQRMQLVDEQA